MEDEYVSVLHFHVVFTTMGFILPLEWKYDLQTYVTKSGKIEWLYFWKKSKHHSQEDWPT